jgi:FtsZ-binding cell division protein ZapB
MKIKKKGGVYMKITHGVELPGIERNTVYYLHAKLHNNEMTADACFLGAFEILKEWIAEKTNACTEISNLINEHLLSGMDSSYGGYRLRTTLLEGITYKWAFLLTHPDTSVAARVWETQVILQKSGDIIEIHVSVSYTASREDSETKVEYSRPGFIESISEYIGIVQGEPITEKPWIINTQDDINKLYSLIISAERNVPVVIITSPDWKKWNYEGLAPKYLIDANRLATECFSSCFVAEVPYYQNFDWNKKVGPSWATFDGSIRIFAPNWFQESEKWFLHPLFKKTRIMEWGKNKETNPALAFYKYLRSAIITGRFTTEKAHGQLTFSEVYREKLDSDSRKAESTQADKITLMQEIIDELKEQVQKEKEEYDSLYEKWSEIDDENDALKEDNFKLRQSNATLMRALANNGDRDKLETIIDIPDDYDEMPQWCERYFSNSLVLHSRARRELKNHENLYEDSSLVYKCLMLLGIEYHKMKLGELSIDEVNKKSDELHVELGPSVTAVTAGMAKDQYQVVGQDGQKHQLDLHIRKGNSYDPKYSLCIYFYWDDDNAKVVVGWLTSHLDSKGTS